MRRWGLLVLVLYALVLVLLTFPALSLIFGVEWQDIVRSVRRDGLGDTFSWPYWLGIAVFLLAQASLLDIHIGTAHQRPVTRRTVVPAIALSGLMMGLLGAGVALAVRETLTRKPEPVNIAALVALAVTWLFWAGVFFLWSRKLDPEHLAVRLRRAWFAGSILELLVAVPAHLLARHRNYCCAGFDTGLGLIFGLALMICSFGPGVFFLFLGRWKKLRHHRSGRL